MKDKKERIAAVRTHLKQFKVGDITNMGIIKDVKDASNRVIFQSPEGGTADVSFGSSSLGQPKPTLLSLKKVSKSKYDKMVANHRRIMTRASSSRPQDFNN